VWFIAQIRLLYRIEDEIRALPPADRKALRQERAPAIWKAMKDKAEELKPTLLPKSTIGDAVRYFLNDYDALVGYLDDGRFEIDNNLIENPIRPTAVAPPLALHWPPGRRLAQRSYLLDSRQLSSPGDQSR
jgi:hypothetical protein